MININNPEDVRKAVTYYSEHGGIISQLPSEPTPPIIPDVRVEGDTDDGTALFFACLCM